MKSLFALFFLLTCTFASSLAYTTTGKNLSSEAVSDFHLEKNIQADITPSYSAFTSTNNDTIQQELATCIDDDDFDENTKSSHRYFIAFCYAFVLKDSYAVTPNSQSSYKPVLKSVSCRYILNRSLRI